MGFKAAKLTTAIALATAAGFAEADVLGGTLGVTYWNAGVSGDVVSAGTAYDIEDVFGIEDAPSFEIEASFEHPIPVLPNIKFRYLTLDETSDSNNTLVNTYSGLTDADSTTLDLSQSDLILYYEILDNYVSVDVGLDIKKFSGRFSVTGEGLDGSGNTVLTNVEFDIDKVRPALYASAEVELPVTDWGVRAEVSYYDFDDDVIQDVRAGIQYELTVAYLELGYRIQSLEMEGLSGRDLKVDSNGVYFSAGLDF